MLIPGVMVPISIIGTFAAMYLLGYSLNNFSLMALTIATGFVVDDAVVVLENIARHMEMGRSRLQAALEGTKEVAFTVFSISLSLIGVFLPILLMGGIIGRFISRVHDYAFGCRHDFARALSDGHADDVFETPAKDPSRRCCGERTAEQGGQTGSPGSPKLLQPTCCVFTMRTLRWSLRHSFLISAGADRQYGAELSISSTWCRKTFSRNRIPERCLEGSRLTQRFRSSLCGRSWNKFRTSCKTTRRLRAWWRIPEGVKPILAMSG